jgi:hypothetical protein
MYHLASRIQDNIKKYKPISPRSILPMNYKLRLAKPAAPHFPDVGVAYDMPPELEVEDWT